MTLNTNNKSESAGLKHFNDPKTFIEYSNDMQDVYKIIDEYNADKEHKLSIVFDDTIADMIDNKKLNSIVTKLFIRDRKLNISLVFITQSYFKILKNVRLSSTHFFTMITPNKRKLQQNVLSLQIIYQTLTPKISLRSTKNILLQHIIF